MIHIHLNDCSSHLVRPEGDCVKAETVIYFTEKEEGFANLLTEIGITRKMAKVLVFLVNMPEATTHMIEAGTDMRQPEVSFAMGLLKKRGWITSSEYKNRRTKRRKSTNLQNR